MANPFEPNRPVPPIAVSPDEAARLAGASRLRVLSKHIMPGLRASLMVLFAFHFADMLIAESALSFLGIGAPLNSSTWGNMLAASRDKLFYAPWMMLAPATAIVFSVITANLVGDVLGHKRRPKTGGSRS